MFDEYIKKQLRAGEEIIAIVRRSPLAHFKALLIACVFIIASFFLLFPLFRMGSAGIIGFVILLLVGISLLTRCIIVIAMNVLVVTSQRVIDINQKKMFLREVSECTYENIQEMTFRISGVLGTFFHVGTLIIHTAGTRADLAAEGIKHPQMVQELISSIQKKMHEQDRSTAMSADELMRLLDALRTNADMRRLLLQARHEQSQEKSIHPEEPHGTN